MYDRDSIPLLLQIVRARPILYETTLVLMIVIWLSKIYQRISSLVHLLNTIQKVVNSKFIAFRAGKLFTFIVCLRIKAQNRPLCSI